ncbi:hypothetical protein BJ170DRAFT_643542 [Xylariales sp. AK1849]|nr:hypothetical protein BJ170DRAFT_643542 [Xylariales sp. AK1849]
MAPHERKLSLPASFLQELGAPTIGSSARAGRHRHPQPSRKDQRKAQRVQKKQAQRVSHSRSSLQSQQNPKSRFAAKKQSHQARAKPGAPSRQLPDGDDQEVGDAFDLDEDSGLEPDGKGSSGEEALEMDDDDESVDENPQLSKPGRRKLGKEDTEIAALEKKLGLKRGKKPKADEDGLDDLLEGFDDLDDDDVEITSRSKRKAEADEWLAQKRRKANAAATTASAVTSAVDTLDEGGDCPSDSDGEEDDISNLENSDVDDVSDVDVLDSNEEEDHDGTDDFGGFSDDEEAVPAAPRQRENPYVAPSTGVAKYVPPSLRKRAESTDEVDAQLHRRVQGLMNRLTNENMIGILKDFSALYDKFPRQSVTSSLVDLLLTLVCSPEKRPEGFFTMIAGFTAAAQKTLGVHVSANLVQRIVQTFKEHHDQASGDQSDAASKHLIFLLAELYNMQVVGSRLVFDYVRLFLDKMSELNTELLLRILQTCGPSLRREDPHSLKDIISRIKPNDLENVSVRTGFMIDEMKKLQSNKTKAAARNKDLAEQRTQIRKRIGTLSGSRESQPLGMGLKEIENADKNGKWWVVGASWSGNREKDQQADAKRADGATDDAVDFVDDDDLGVPDLWQLAKEQGFNTEVRQQIFVALHAATDYGNAELLLRKLRLNKHQRKELPEVIVRSGESQTEFNRYYWLVASRFCGDRELAFQFRRSLTARFRKMGEDIDTGDDDYDADDDETYDPRRVVNIGKFYGNLVANRSLGLDILRYRNLAALQEKTQWFVEVLLITVLQESDKEALQKIFGSLDQDLARGIQYFLNKHVRKTKLISSDEKKLVKKQISAADAMLQALLIAPVE